MVNAMARIARSFKLAPIALAALLTIGAAPLEVSLESGSMLEAVERLRAGEYLWTPQFAPEGPVLVVVNLTTQRSVVYRNGVPIGVSTVSTGKAGHRTPAGIYTILQKRVRHRSSTYNNAPMPYMQRLTWRGIALHAGNLPGVPASHGCIRLPMAFARNLFGVTELGMTVVVTRGWSVPLVAPTPQLLKVRPADDLVLPSPSYAWNPERAPAGPVSILVSGADRRVTVLRNGVEIGRAPVSFDGTIDRTTAFTLQSADANGLRWLRLALPGQSGMLGADEWQRFRIPSGFKKAMASVAALGTTVIITGDSLRPSEGRQTADILEFDPIG
jgi:hypothetical protein